MATSISTTFESIYLTGNLPEKVMVTTNQQSITIEVTVNGDVVFSSVYYPYNQMVTLCDVRSVVEQAMMDEGLDMATMEIIATERNGTTATVQGVKVIYSEYKSPYPTATFLLRSFLTLRKSAVIPRNGYMMLYNHSKAYVQSNNYAKIYYRLRNSSGTVYTCNINLSATQTQREEIVSARLTHAYFKQLVDNHKGVDCLVAGVEYHIGQRRFNIFFTDERPTELFRFINAFGLVETYYLYGATTTKRETDRSEAVCGRMSEYYDETILIKHEVETAPLPYDEAMWLSQMLTTRWVAIQIADGEDAQKETAEVMIGDIASEVTDSRNDLIRLKFSWKYAEGTEWMKDNNMF